VDLITDKQTRKSKCFAFVYFKSDESAAKAKEKSDGLVLHEHSVRIEFSITKKAHSPTPGRYLGRSTRPPRFMERMAYARPYDYYRRSSPPRYDRRDYDDRYDRYDRYDRSAYDRYAFERSMYDRGYDRSAYEYGRRPYR